jgi:hypothetical protein
MSLKKIVKETMGKRRTFLHLLEQTEGCDKFYPMEKTREYVKTHISCGNRQTLLRLTADALPRSEWMYYQLIERPFAFACTLFSGGFISMISMISMNSMNRK